MADEDIFFFLIRTSDGFEFRSAGIRAASIEEAEEIVSRTYGSEFGFTFQFLVTNNLIRFFRMSL